MISPTDLFHPKFYIIINIISCVLDGNRDTTNYKQLGLTQRPCRHNGW